MGVPKAKHRRAREQFHAPFHFQPRHGELRPKPRSAGGAAASNASGGWWPRRGMASLGLGGEGYGRYGVSGGKNLEHVGQKKVETEE